MLIHSFELIVSLDMRGSLQMRAAVNSPCECRVLQQRIVSRHGGVHTNQIERAWAL
jgi:hypothetical protein